LPKDATNTAIANKAAKRCGLYAVIHVTNDARFTVGKSIMGVLPQRYGSIMGVLMKAVVFLS
jgi:hypothetical protein